MLRGLSWQLFQLHSGNFRLSLSHCLAFAPDLSDAEVIKIPLAFLYSVLNLLQGLHYVEIQIVRNESKMFPIVVSLVFFTYYKTSQYNLIDLTLDSKLYSILRLVRPTNR